MAARGSGPAGAAPRLVVLGAGAPHRGSVPTALRRDVAGTPVLDWVLAAAGVAPADAAFVAGYQAAQVRARYPGVTVVEAADWASTGAAASLLAAPFAPGGALVVCYSDVLFRAEHVAALAAAGSGADVAVAYDSRWRDRFAGRAPGLMRLREKVLVDGGTIARVGADVADDDAHGEFIGLMRLDGRALALLDALRRDPPPELARAHLAGLLEVLRAAGLTIAAIDVAGDWAEVDEPRDVARFVLGTKAQTLDRLRGAITTATIQDQVAFTVAQWRADPAPWTARVVERFGSARLVVRSSARGEDSFTASNAGGYDSVLGVDAERGLADAVERVAASYGPGADDEQVLVQPMVEDVVVAGVAFTRTLEHGAPWVVVNYDATGDTASITSGGSATHRTLVVRRAALADGGRPPAVAGSPVAPLFDALAEIEALLAHDALDVEFALDAAGTVHVLQVRPLVVGEPDVTDADVDAALEAAHARWRARAASPAHLPGDAAPLFGVMPDWNPAEIIGTAPGALAVDLYRHLIMDEVWAAQRAGYGYRDVRPAPLLETFAGRPYVDVRASFASFLPADLDDALAGRLLAAALDRLRARPELHDKVEFAVVPTCVDPDLERWRRLLSADGFVPADVDRLLAGLTRITAQALTRGEEDRAAVDAVAAGAAALVAADLDPTERARRLLDGARPATLAFAHLARSAFVAVSLLRGAEAAGVVTHAAVEGFLSTIRTVSHELTHDARAVADGTLARDAFVARYGHLRPGTYDVVSPRYDADPARYLDPLVAHAAADPQGAADADAAAAEGHRAWERERPAFLAALAALGLPADAPTVEGFLRRSIEGREWAKFVFTRSLSDALEQLVAAAARHGIDRRTLADASLADALALTAAADGPTVAAVAARARERAHARRVTAACELPPLLTREDDLDAFVLGAETPNFVGSTAVTAPVVELGPAAEGEGGTPAAEVAGRIALVPQADPGYDWLFGQGIVGLVTQYGGANSHMAIRAAEFGLPAAIGVGEQRYRQVTGAAVVELDPAGRLLRVVR